MFESQVFIHALLPSWSLLLISSRLYSLLFLRTESCLDEKYPQRLDKREPLVEPVKGGVRELIDLIDHT